MTDRDLARITGGQQAGASCWNATKNSWDVHHDPWMAAGIGGACLTGNLPPQTRATPAEIKKERELFDQWRAGQDIGGKP